MLLKSEKQKQRTYENLARKKHKEKEEKFFRDKLADYIKQIKEVNVIAKELKRNVYLEVKISYAFTSVTEMNDDTI